MNEHDRHNEWFNQQNKKQRLARKILGVSQTASIEDIRKQYYLLSMKYHPDKNPNQKTAIRHFQNIQNAYEFLIHHKENVSFDSSLVNSADKPSEGAFNMDNDWG